jgi:hypothetical protein
MLKTGQPESTDMIQRNIRAWGSFSQSNRDMTRQRFCATSDLVVSILQLVVQVQDPIW